MIQLFIGTKDSIIIVVLVRIESFGLLSKATTSMPKEVLFKASDRFSTPFLQSIDLAEEPTSVYSFYRWY